MTSNRRRHAEPPQVKHLSQSNHLKLLTENSLTRQRCDLCSQPPNPKGNSVQNLSVSCSLISYWFMWKCHHSSASAGVTDVVILMWLLPPLLSPLQLHVVLLSSCLHHYPSPLSPFKGKRINVWNAVRFYEQLSIPTETLTAFLQTMNLFASMPVLSKFTLSLCCILTPKPSRTKHDTLISNMPRNSF